LKLDGFPAWWDTRTPRALNVDPAQIKEVMAVYTANLYSPLEHMLFYPEMRKMGYEPSEKAVSPTREHLLGRAQAPTELDNLNLAINYLTIFLEFRPQDREVIEKIYRERRWDQAVLDGKKLRDIAQQSVPMTADSIVVAFARCMTVLSGKTTYEFAGWADRKAGKDRVFKVAILKATPTADPDAKF
jgi:hypothetical protein